MKTHFKTVLAWSLVLAFAAFPVASRAADPAGGNVSTDPNVSVALHGFVDTSLFWQDQNFFFGNGQNAEFPLPPAIAGQHNNLSGGDVRNTRVWIDLAGPTM